MTRWSTTLKMKSTLIIFLLLGNEIGICQATVSSTAHVGGLSILSRKRLYNGFERHPFSNSGHNGESCARGDKDLATVLLLTSFGEELNQTHVLRSDLWSAQAPTATLLNEFPRIGVHAQFRRLQGRRSEHAGTPQSPIDHIRSSNCSPRDATPPAKHRSIDLHGFHRRRSPGWQDISPGNTGTHPLEKAFAYWSGFLLQALFVVYGTVCIFAELIVAGDCGGVTEGIPNAALYAHSPSWRSVRHPLLLGLTKQEADFGRRVMAAALAGSLIGVERCSPKRAAGVRAMATVSLAACLFTIASMFAFEGGTQTWDASRVSAALPQGVGFLGAAAIFKVDSDMKGFTTATSIWLSCAVGLLCGGELYCPAFFGVAAIVAILRSVADKKLLANMQKKRPGVQHFGDTSKKHRKEPGVMWHASCDDFEQKKAREEKQSTELAEEGALSNFFGRRRKLKDHSIGD